MAFHHADEVFKVPWAALLGQNDARVCGRLKHPDKRENIGFEAAAIRASLLPLGRRCEDGTKLHAMSAYRGRRYQKMTQINSF
jgi:hypothetical protein